MHIVIILIFAAAILGIGELWNEIEFLPGTATANGRADFCQEVHTYKRSYCEATVSFETQAGRSIVFREAVNSVKEGDAVVVRYHPDNPEDARIDHLSNDLIVLGFGLGLLPIDIGIFWYWKRRRKYIEKKFYEREKPCLSE